MNKIEIEEIIRVINRTCVNDVEFPTHATAQEVSHHIFAQQGVQSVIRVLRAIGKGDIKPSDYPEVSPED